ncbi:MAG: DNA polymerase III subunit alpha [Deltaproteobacteria bacterium]|nr:DNA polymerase III subunit alpha [Deltaproteobacteria bacterium]
MGARPFVHLHVHTQFSLLDGAIRLSDLLARAEELAMPAVAMTDHGNMFGALDLYTRAKGKPVRPILGCEVYLAAGPRSEKSQKPDTHLVLLATDREGYRNLSYLVSMGYLEGLQQRPRVDREILGARSKGLIALSGCLGGAVAQSLLHHGPDEALAMACGLRDLFDRDSFYLEIQDHGFPEQAQVNRILADIGERAGIQLVATNDAHFLGSEDAASYQVLTCIAAGRTLAADAAVQGPWTQMYLKSGDEMAAALREYPRALDNTLAIAERCRIDFDLGKTYLPRYEVPGGHDLETFLGETATEGLERRLAEARDAGRAVDDSTYRARLAMELDVICRMGFAGYFLIVWDFIRHAREKGIPVGPGRGSGAGSLVAWSLRITNLDPIPYNLLFERFLNPERVSMPDFDIDFCMDRRDEVIEYVTHKYGELQVGQIATFHELKSRSCVRDVGRALGFAYAEVDKIAKLVPEPVQGKTTSVPEALEKEPRLKELYDKDERIKTLLDHAIRLEGLNRHAGMHAAGVVIADKPMYEYVPVFRGQNGELVSQFDKDLVEKVGLVKFDFLGLKTLTVIDIAVDRLIRKRPDSGDFDLDRLPLDDAETYKLLQSGETTGVFQLESSGMQDLFRKLRPDRFEDIVAAVALYRPGPLETGMVEDYVQRKHGRTEVRYPHPMLEDALRETHGVIVYQEQVMQIARAMAGFTLGQADLLRRAMGKKKPEEMAKQKAVFVDGAKARGVPEAKAREVFELLEVFAGYGFNKCVVGDTVIVDAATGERTTVGELFRNRRPFIVHALGDDWRLRLRKVQDVVTNGKRLVYEVRTAQGRRIRATANHPVRTLDGWTTVGELETGYRVAAARRLSVSGRGRWPRHELVTLAGLLSEGNTCHPSCLYFFGNDPVLVDDFARAAACFPKSVARVSNRGDGRLEVCVSTGTDARFRPGQRPWNLGRDEDVLVEGNLALAVPRRSGAFEWAKELGILGIKATAKRVPGPVFALADEDLELFLGRLWSGDGYIAGETQATPFYATSSERLARDVQLLLLRLGIPSGVHSKSFKYRGAERAGFTVHLVGERSVEAFLARVTPHCVGRERQVDLLRSHVTITRRGCSSKDTIPPAVRRWVDAERRGAGLTWLELERRSGVSTKELVGNGSRGKRGFRRGTIAKLAAFFASQRLADLAASDVFWDRVVAVERRGIEETYDLTIEGDHNFVADGLVVHNSHSAAYALISYQTAYLKAHYPVEYMCALLTADKDKTEKVVRSIAEGRSMGITILPPDVNSSGEEFTVVYPPDGSKPAIRFGLGAVKGVGGSALETLFEARREGPFRDLFDFATRVDVRKVNKGVFEALVWSGAFDVCCRENGVSRAQAHAAIDAALERGRARAKERESGQTNLFGLFDAGAVSSGAGRGEYPSVAGWDSKTLLAYERQALGFYITGHPLDRYRAELGRLANTTTADIAERDEGSQVVIGGVVEAYRERVPKTGGRMAFFDLEDSSGRVEVIVRTRTFAQVEAVLKSGEPLLVIGAVQVDREREEPEAKVLLESVQPLAEAARARARTVHIHLEAHRVSDRELQSLRALLAQHPGRCPVSIHIRVPAASDTVLTLSDELAVEPAEALLASLERLFGATVAELR